MKQGSEWARKPGSFQSSPADYRKAVSVYRHEMSVHERSTVRVGRQTRTNYESGMLAAGWRVCVWNQRQNERLARTQ